MIQSLYMITLTMSLTFMFLSHPLSMGFILMIQAIMISMITGMMAHNFWFSYILFMVMIGGMLVLFIYMTSVASNEKFLFSLKLTSMVSLMILISTIPMMMDSYPNYYLSSNNEMTSSSLMTMFSMSLSKYISFPSNLIMIMMIIYLLVTLIAVVKITNITYGPLRQSF